MDKPMILVEHDMREELVGVVNKYASTLPMMLIVSALSDMTKSCTEVADQQYKVALEQYNESLEKVKATIEKVAESEVESDG